MLCEHRMIAKCYGNLLLIEQSTRIHGTIILFVYQNHDICKEDTLKELAIGHAQEEVVRGNGIDRWHNH